MGNKFRYLNGEGVTVDNIRKGRWIKTKTGGEHRITDCVPRKCDECGFPAMNITSRDFKDQTLTLGCPWCDVHRELCLVCGRMEYLLRDHHH